MGSPKKTVQLDELDQHVTPVDIDPIALARQQLAKRREAREARAETDLATEVAEEVQAAEERDAELRELYGEFKDEALRLNAELQGIYREVGFRNAQESEQVQEIQRELETLIETLPEEGQQEALQKTVDFDSLLYQIDGNIELVNSKTWSGNPWAKLLSPRVRDAANLGFLREATGQEAEDVEKGKKRVPYIRIGNRDRKQVFVPARPETASATDLFYGRVAVDENGNVVTDEDGNVRRGVQLFTPQGEPVTDKDGAEVWRGGLHGLRITCGEAAARHNEEKEMVNKERAALCEDHPATPEAIDAVINGEGGHVAGYFFWDRTDRRTKREYKSREFASVESIGNAVRVTYTSGALYQQENQLVERDESDRVWNRVRAALDRMKADAEAGTVSDPDPEPPVVEADDKEEAAEAAS